MLYTIYTFGSLKNHQKWPKNTQFQFSEINGWVLAITNLLKEGNWIWPKFWAARVLDPLKLAIKYSYTFEKKQNWIALIMISFIHFYLHRYIVAQNFTYFCPIVYPYRMHLFSSIGSSPFTVQFCLKCIIQTEKYCSKLREFHYWESD